MSLIRGTARTRAPAGGSWVHLRVCRSCGHVGCCDSSPNKHASAHVAGTDHPIVSSLEPGENWSYCYVDDLAFVASAAPGVGTH